LYVLRKRNGNKSNVKKKIKSLLFICERNKNKKSKEKERKINLLVSFFFFFVNTSLIDFCPKSEKIGVNKKIIGFFS
jgi:hypothetical protein